jgi:hypothetical protein
LPLIEVRWSGLKVALALLISVAGPLPASAQPFAPVTDRNFAIDLYRGPVLGSVQVVGMGGAQIAVARGAAGLEVNPAAAAVRPATSLGRWDWDWNLDYTDPNLGTDFDNNGLTGAGGLTDTFIATGGLVINFKRWAAGVSTSVHTIQIDNNGRTLEAAFSVTHLTVSRRIAEEWVAGTGIRLSRFGLSADDQPSLIELIGSALEGGLIWMPKAWNLRLGMSGALAATADEVKGEGCSDPLDCQGFIIPGRVVAPWQLGAGAAWRWADSPWHRPVRTPWRDERAVLMAIDVVVTGAVDGGHGIERYVQAHELQPSGRGLALSARTGLDYEWLPGRLRVRAGTYWEPSRFPGVGGRVHLTGGFDLRVWQFQLWSRPRRVRLSFTADVARRYGNTGLSFGFWH